MASTTLGDLLNSIQGILTQDTTLPTGTDINVQVNFINQALVEWGNAYQWRQLRFTSPLSFTVSATSVGLPYTFKKLQSPVFDVSKTPAVVFNEIPPEEINLKLPTDQYVVIRGNRADGQYMLINPPMASGLSLQYDWQAIPSSLVTNQDIVVCPNPQYLVNRTLSKILFARSDPRFQAIAGEADNMLANMIEEEGSPSLGQKNQTRNQYAINNFRIGNDG